MIKHVFITFLIFTVAFVKAQSRTTIDSLWEVKDYIQALRESIPNNVNQGAVKMTKLDSLIGLGTQNKKLFDKQLHLVLSDRQDEIKILLRKYDLVLQSVILVKTDMEQQQLNSRQAKMEKHYFYQNASFLIDRIYFCVNYYKIKIEQNTH
ncbi:hypothetical protein [Flavobacterium sp. WC2430]|uniref:hypothetical protein n=1 Tax=Flavobacterium sp. WC2430 TaxID=3234137 RepID=UPI003466D5C0